MLAAASATAAGRPGGRELLDEALGVLLEHFWDDEFGMVVEQWDESFTTLDGYRGVNANMHTVEALLSAADVTRRRRRCATGRCGSSPGSCTTSRAATSGGSRSTSTTPGRRCWTTTSTSRRTRSGRTARRSGTGWSGPGWRCTCAPALGDAAPDWLLDDARSLFDASVREGWAVDGADGFVYTVDWSGAPVVRERMHWVAAEATATAAALHAATGDASYADWYATWWQHVADCFLDPEHGSWRHELSPDEPAEQRDVGRASRTPTTRSRPR